MDNTTHAAHRRTSTLRAPTPPYMHPTLTPTPTRRLIQGGAMFTLAPFPHATPFSSRRPFYQSRAPSPPPMAHSHPSPSTNTLTNHSTFHHRPPTTTYQHLPPPTTTSSHLHRPPTATRQHPPPTTTSIHLPSPTTFTTSSHLPSPTTHIPPPTPPPPPRTAALLAPPAPSRRRLQRLLGSDGLAMHGSPLDWKKCLLPPHL
jgi:hypothetical protein